ncbi:hypothetical protein [Urbifossiella limnaea]|uniref:Uncharacterized protein n=1 Tax=Urbifossiella limnaea TaxID=2528023 RepID=A0A517Y1J4_9BACT|nr:hypothetical protein [Urbifossiella limnaea]QDU23603.1 hypothetical protein ETAA1_56070 [Urbifossiella limnaea]
MIRGRLDDEQPHGVHFNTDRSVATVMFDGPAPDPAVLARLKQRLGPSGLAITAHP